MVTMVKVVVQDLQAKKVTLVKLANKGLWVFQD